MPHMIQPIFPQDNLSAIPTRPIVVVAIRMSGPVKASAELTANALSTWFIRSMMIAAMISKLPEKTRREAMLTTNLSIILNNPPFRMIMDD